METFGNIILHHGDCMDILRELPDNAYDLAIVDPPYSNGNGKCKRTGGTWAAKYGTAIKGWDIAPSNEYFQTLFRVSRNQIIWGGNYFSLPPTRCFLVWRKTNIAADFTMSMAEYAWTSFDSNSKVYECVSNGTPNNPRIHPTQKPIALYAWLLNNYAKPGDKILDTHLGSGSSAIAAHELNFEFLGIEIDEHYYNAAKHRLAERQKQLKLF